MKERNITQKLTEKDFDTIKALQMAGLRRERVMEITNRSTYTVAMVNKVANWEEYKKLRAERYQHRIDYKEGIKADPKVVVDPKVTELPHLKTPREELDFEYMNMVNHRAAETIVVLNRIANSLERLADAWESKPKPRKFF